MNQIEGRVVLVTGGAAGIGRALCEQLAAQGALVVVADINVDGAQAVAAAIRQVGGHAESAHVDVSDAEEVDKVVNRAATIRGRLDCMINNAAISAVGELRDGNVEDFRRVVDVDLFGVVHGTMAAYRVMVRQGFGHILNLSSVTGLMPSPLLSAYSTTKWAIVGFSTALRAEAADLGVKVSVACPALVRTSIADRGAYWNVSKDDYLSWLPWKNTMLSPEEASAAILRGMRRNQAIIVCPLLARMAWRVHRVWPGAFAPLVRRTVKSFRALRLKP